MPLTIPCALSPIDAQVDIPGSKSITNRALLLGSLAKGETLLKNVLLSDDTFAFITALRKLGVSIEVDTARSIVCIRGVAGNFFCSYAKIHCEDAGTVARFLLAVCANQVGEFKMDGSLRLRERPLQDLIQVLRGQGTRIFSDCLPLRLKSNGRLKGGNIFIPSHLSSQFLSGLLMIAPYCKHDVILTTNQLVSEPYVDMTCRMMSDFGVEVLRQTRKWQVQVNQIYQARVYSIESDFSSASYFFAAAAVTGGKVTVLNMKRTNSLQGDSAFLDVLERMGCVVESQDDNIMIIGPSKLKGIAVDMYSISDTMMTLAAIAPFADSPTRIFNVANTRIKESDRISVMANNLRHLGIRVDEEIAGLTIYPGTPASGMIKTHRDHRIAMACSLIGLKVPGIIIDDIHCVNKTFPSFFSMLQKVI